MYIKNNGKGESSITQNRFTAYLLTEISKRKADYLQGQARRERIELLADMAHPAFLESGWQPELSVLFSDCCENEVLDAVLKSLSDWDRYIFAARALYQRTFEEFSAELDLGYQGAAAVYHRVRKKIRKALEESGMNFKEGLLRAKEGGRRSSGSNLHDVSSSSL